MPATTSSRSWTHPAWSPNNTSTVGLDDLKVPRLVTCPQFVTAMRSEPATLRPLGPRRNGLPEVS